MAQKNSCTHPSAQHITTQHPYPEMGAAHMHPQYTYPYSTYIGTSMAARTVLFS